MVRPTKLRNVEFFPEGTYFIPSGKPKCEIEEINLKVEELEALRLKDIEDLKQEECAEKMEVSRQTFQNILNSARKKVALALTEGNAIRICDGNYKTSSCQFKCSECGSIYDINYREDKHTCPECGSTQVFCTRKSENCKKWCRKRNQRD